LNKLINFIKSWTGEVYKAGAILALFGFISRLVGLLRDRILASEFGASRTLDIYYSAFKIPDFIFNLIVLGAVSAAFIPVFISEFKKEEDSAWKLAQNFLNLLFLVVVGVVILGIIFARPLTKIVSPGFGNYDFELTVIATQIMFLSPIFFTISTIFGSILQSFKKFFFYSLAPVFYNLGIISGAVLFVPLFKSVGLPEIEGLAFGVVFGAILHLVIQIPSVYKIGFRWRLYFNWRESQIRKVFKLMIPRTIALAGNSINTLLMNAIISFLPAGSIAIFNFGYNLHYVPVALVGISMGTAIFPTLTEHIVANQTEDFRRKLDDVIKRIILISLIIAILFIVFSQPIVKLLLGVGNFDGASVEITARVLIAFMFGVVAHSLIHVLVRAFYAVKDTRTPTIISLFSIFFGLGLALFFIFYLKLGILSAAISLSISVNLNFILLWIAFKKLLKKL
jgi:putative peptidoglycan lipid II flippase